MATASPRSNVLRPDSKKVVLSSLSCPPRVETGATVLPYSTGQYGEELRSPWYVEGKAVHGEATKRGGDSSLSRLGANLWTEVQ